MDDKRRQLSHLVIEHQKATFQAMQSSEKPEWLDNDMTMPQFKILFLLYSFGRKPMSEIANKLGKNISTATGIVDRLVEQGLIKREEDPDDRRKVIIRLTERGIELCQSFLQAGWQHAERVMNRLTLEELQIVEQGTRMMAKVAIEDARERMGAPDAHDESERGFLKHSAYHDEDKSEASLKSN